MKILGIETSCDETAVCVVEADSTGSPQADGNIENLRFSVLGDALYSQAKTHAEYGGVFPSLAKREHAKNLPPLLEKALREAKIYHSRPSPLRLEDSTPPQGYGEEAEHNTTTSPFPPYPWRDAESAKQGGEMSDKLRTILAREPGLFEGLQKILETIERPELDAIAVTRGPGLEPALWVGINFARALGVAWNIPVIPANHMEGHIVSPLLGKERCPERVSPLRRSSSEASESRGCVVKFPALALLISGGHTELVLAKNWLSYEVIGRTRDDAVGEAFDKVARLLSLPYPGGPQISKLAEEARSSPSFSKEGAGGGVRLPRPMLKTPDYDFSFSGIKTAVLYAVKKLQLPPHIPVRPPARQSHSGGSHPGGLGEVPSRPASPELQRGERGGGAEVRTDLPDEIKKEFALEFENAVTEVLVEKTRRAIEEYNIKTLIIGGGVVANIHIRNSFKKLIEAHPDTKLLIPEITHSTDNALMIAAAAYLNILMGAKHQEDIKAEGNLSF